MKKDLSDRAIDAPQANIWYLHHSGFAVETAGHFLVFDYSCDKPESEVRSLESGVVTPGQLDKDKKIVVFVSHGHGDHFSHVIFDWQDDRPDIVYVLSSDIKPRVGQNLQNSYLIIPQKVSVLNKIS